MTSAATMTPVLPETPATEKRGVFACSEWLGDVRFGVILADPPWDYGCKSPTAENFETLERDSNPAGISHYYQTMPLDEICALPVSSIAEENSVLFLWATVPLMPEAFRVVAAWGYKYKTMLTWEKENGKGMGYWFRGVTEHCLLGVRGDVKAFRSPIKNLIRNKVGRHSAKPQKIHEIIESVTPGMKRVELFARLKCAGWDAWGNQVEQDLLSTI